MKNQTAPLREKRTNTFDSVDFIFILFHKVGSIMRGKNYRAKDREEQKEKARCVF